MKLFRVAALTGAALGTYSFVEPMLFRLTTKRVPLPAGAPSLTILHVSDTHMRRRSRRLRAWLETLPKLLEETPDIVVATGDFIDDDGGIDPLLECFARLEARLGRFYVLGSHDYYQSRFDPWTKYFTRSKPRKQSHPADTRKLQDGLHEDGWIPLINTTYVLGSPYGPIRMAGVDDPYLDRHTTDHIERGRDDVLAIGLVHAPDVVSEWLLAGFDLVVAGHTHGGQVRVPGFGAVVTNCSLPASLAAGLHRVGGGWLHVSPGLSASRFSPIRFACRPEATLLRLEPTGSGPGERRP
ncbi:MAG TPA: metallophosphoesterase [Actinomycetota bacterium]|nr:metallophosphoesterase [Actinomycetota bacterium]